MHAAVVTAFDSPPAYQEFPTPAPQAPDEVLVDVLAAGLHPRVRSQANGSHYTSTDELPLVPGIDGVGRTGEGELRYFVLPDTTLGAMAEHTVVDLRRSVLLPEGTDPVPIAAAMNPAMSSWIALRRRIDFRPGQSVLVLGATGNAGRMAVQIAKHLGASRVVAAGRREDQLATLPALGADETVALAQGGPEQVADRLGNAASEIDVVIDYLWGEPAVNALIPLVTHRADESRPLTWIQIGSVAGPTAAIPSAALRAVPLRIVGSGQGSVSPRDIVAELPELAAEIARGSFAVDARAVPLRDVAEAWKDTDTDRRIVVMP
jgi:NADPH:quinone reductase-like Zn-dependent oxidoreductase